MRKYVALALICVLSVFSMVGCGKSTTTEQKSASTESAKSSESTEKSTPSTENKSSENEVKTLKISGNFYSQADDDHYTFNSDGSLFIYEVTKDGNIGAPGQFTQNDDQLVIYVGDADEDSKKVYSYTYDGKTLVLKDAENGEVLTLVKEEK